MNKPHVTRAFRAPRVGSLCSGYGGLELGLITVVGGSVAWHVEYDKHPSAVLDVRFPGVPNYGDVTTTDWTQVEPVDWLTAGYPCQPFSHAGKRKGSADERHLWPAVADAIGVLRPRRVLLENVAGHVSLGLDAVLADLAALGYDATWGVVRAADAGAPHNRARVFIVAIDTGHGTRSTEHRQQSALTPVRAGQSGAGAPADTRDAAPDGQRARSQPGQRGATPADASGERHGGGQDGRSLGRLDREDAGEARERQRTRAVTGDRGAAAPTDADDRGSRDGRTGANGRRWALYSVGAGEPAAHAGCGGWGEADPRGRGLVGQSGLQAGRDEGAGSPRPDRDAAWGAYGPAIARWELVTGRPAPRPTEPGRTGERLSPRFVEWMMGLPAGWVTDILPRNPALKALGNGVVPQQAALAVRTLLNVGSVAA